MMTEYDVLIRSAEITAEELPILIGCLVNVAKADGVFSDDERKFLSDMVELFSGGTVIDLTAGNFVLSKSELQKLSCPEIAVMLAYMLSYIDGCFSESENQVIESIAKLLNVSDKRRDELHLFVKKKLYNTAFFSVYEDLSEIPEKQEQLDKLRKVLGLGLEEAKVEELRVRKELEGEYNAKR